jgi:imidazole glycerol-phosphate synthase subunit HisF
MHFKRIIYALLYSRGQFYLSRNFSLQRVGDVEWLKKNYGFGETCNFIDELMIINVTKDPTENDKKMFFKDINHLREKIFVPLTLGGGIRTIDDAKKYFNNGADKVLVNFLAHKNLKICNSISKIYGEQALSIMADYKVVNDEIKIFMNSGKVFSMNLEKYIQLIKNFNFGELILNSIDKDGTAAGLDSLTYTLLPDDFKNPILLMGGAGKPEHFADILINERISGVITANLFNFLGKGLEEARNYSIKKKLRLIKFENL